MKYVTFKQIKIKNFLSIGEDQVVVNFNKGLHIITGINRDKEDRRNGVGKSTIADAFYFAIFGTTIRDIKKDFIANNLTQGQCEVQLEFNVNSPKGNDEFTIIRSLNPSKLYVYKNGIDKTRDSIVNTTKYIEAVLSSSPEIFHNCVIMTLNNTLPFMAKSKVEKRKFIEQVFNLQIFSQMLSNLRDEHTNVKKNFDIEVAKHDEIKRNIEVYNIEKTNKVNENATKIANIKSKISTNEKEIAKITQDILSIENINLTEKEANLDRLSTAYNTAEKKIEELIVNVTEIKSDIRQKTVKFNQIGTDNDVCPTCLRPIDKNDRDTFVKQKANIQTEINNLSKDYDNKNDTIQTVRSKLDALKTHITKANNEMVNAKTAIASKEMKENRLQELTSVNQELNESIRTVETNSNVFDELIKQTSDRLENIKIEIDNIKKVINMLDVVKFVVSEEGVKSYIVKKILQNFNSKLAFFLKKLDSNSICVFNEYFEEEILNEKGKICSYNNFSGAERKAIDLACLFSFIDMRKSQGNVHYNISLYDELFDSSLDEKGVELVLEIVKERCEKYNECAFVISHRKESIKFATGDIIFLEKHNGITKRINYVD